MRRGATRGGSKAKKGGGLKDAGESGESYESWGEDGVEAKEEERSIVEAAAGKERNKVEGTR